MCNCDCDACGDWGQPINSWSDYHHALNGAWHATEADLRAEGVPAEVIAAVRHEWFRQSLASLRPETVALLSRGREMN